jgi:pimeloyl-ACP methyl ester carboxylesterase
VIQDAVQLHIRQTGKGTSLLLVHGLLLNGDMFQPVLEGLANDYRILVPDLRGFGRSGHLPPPYTVKQHAHDLARSLEYLSISSTVVLGYSQGGTVAQQLALDYPSLVSQLVLCCTFAYNQLTWQEKLEGLVMPWLVWLSSAKQLAKMVKGLTPTQVKQFEIMVASNHKSRMVEATKEMLRFDSRHRLGNIECPTLVLAGAIDTAVPLHHAHILAHGIPDAKLTIVPHAGHEIVWTHGAQLIEIVKLFLRESEKRTSHPSGR